MVSITEICTSYFSTGHLSGYKIHNAHSAMKKMKELGVSKKDRKEIVRESQK